jgi:hypothetical protein
VNYLLTFFFINGRKKQTPPGCEARGREVLEYDISSYKTTFQLLCDLALLLL